MQQVAFSVYAPYGLCEKCFEFPVFVQKRHLCRQCYRKWYQSLNQPIKKRPSTRLSYTPKPKHNVLWHRKRLIERYGREIINDLKAVKTQQYWNLTEVGKKYGFSREYARRLFKKVFGKSVTKYEKAKTVKRTAEIKSMNCANDPRHKMANYKGGHPKAGAKAELLVFNKCKELGFDVEIPCNQVYDLKINGFNVDVKSSSREQKMLKKGQVGNRSSYYYFGTRPRQHAQCDFYVCHAIPIDTFYIIPKQIMAPTGCHIRANNIRYRAYIPKRVDYDQYKEAWHLLTGQYSTEPRILKSVPNKQSKETIKQKRRAYYLANRERFLAANKKYNESHKEQIAQRNRERYQQRK